MAQRYGKSNQVIVGAVVSARAGKAITVACATSAEGHRVREAIKAQLTPEQLKLVTVSNPRR